MIHVAIVKAFSGSGLALPSPNTSVIEKGKSKYPFRYGVCTDGLDNAGANTVAVASAVKPTTSHVMGAYDVAVFGDGSPFSRASRACRNATTVTRLVMVNSDSALPCNQSLSASDTPYKSLAAIAAGIVKNTNNKHVANPTVTPLGVSFSGRSRKYRKARYGNSDAPKNGPAKDSAASWSIDKFSCSTKAVRVVVAVDRKWCGSIVVVAATSLSEDIVAAADIVVVAAVVASISMDDDKKSIDGLLLLCLCPSGLQEAKDVEVDDCLAAVAGAKGLMMRVFASRFFVEA